MKNPRYTVSDDAPIWVKNILRGSPSRGSIRLLLVLSVLAGLAVVYAERGKITALLSLVFFYYALLAWLGLRWGDRNGLFDGNRGRGA